MKNIFSNRLKKERAEVVADLLTGVKVPLDRNQEDRTSHFNRMAQADKVDLKDKDKVVVWVYEKMGGIMITEAEEKAVVKRKKVAQKKGKTDSMGIKDK